MTYFRSPAMRELTLEHLCGLLKFALKRMMQVSGVSSLYNNFKHFFFKYILQCEPFIHPVNETEFPDYKKYIVQPMDLTRLEKNIKENVYGSTQAFESDAKWILHNSIVFNSCGCYFNLIIVWIINLNYFRSVKINFNCQRYIENLQTRNV